MRCCPLLTACWRMTARRRWRAWDWMPMWASSTGIGPGGTSLALDLMEELRPCFADRFVLTLVNNRVLKASDFETAESGAVLLADAGPQDVSADSGRSGNGRRSRIPI